MDCNYCCFWKLVWLTGFQSSFWVFVTIHIQLILHSWLPLYNGHFFWRTVPTLTLVSTSLQRSPLYNGHFLLSPRWPLLSRLRAVSLFSIVRRAKCETRKWPRAWLMARDGRGCRPRFARLTASLLPRACTALTKSEEKERLLAAYFRGFNCNAHKTYLFDMKLWFCHSQEISQVP